MRAGLWGFCRTRNSLVAVATIAVALSACDKASHENIDKWLETSKGPDKLSDAMRDSGLSFELRGHAAVNLIRIDRSDQVYGYIDQQSPAVRQPLIKAMAPRLWENARVEGRRTVPNRLQTSAKDAMYYLRKDADDVARAQLDGYLIDWLTSGDYDIRALSGAVQGDQILRLLADDPKVSDDAADRMIAALNSIIAAPPGEGGVLRKLSEDLLIGVAVTGSPKAVAKLLEVATSTALHQKYKDLRLRVLVALEKAYVTADVYDNAPRRGLDDDGNIAALAAIAKDERESTTASQVAINLVAAAGLPRCLPPLVEMISHPHSNDRFQWVVADRALSCGQQSSIVPVVEAFLAGRPYLWVDISKKLVDPISAMTPRAKVLEKARILLDSATPLARVVGIEVLGKVASRKDAAADAERVKALTGDKRKLTGFWGDQSDVPRKQRKPTPTVGSRAADVAKLLEELAKGSPK